LGLDKITHFGFFVTCFSPCLISLAQVAELERGEVNGVQHSAQAFFELLSFSIVMGLSEPHQYWISAIISYACVTVALIVYALYVRREEKDWADTFRHARSQCDDCFAVDVPEAGGLKNAEDDEL
jgi:hypothetical protein